MRAITIAEAAAAPITLAAQLHIWISTYFETVFLVLTMQLIITIFQSFSGYNCFANQLRFMESFLGANYFVLPFFAQFRPISIVSNRWLKIMHLEINSHFTDHNGNHSHNMHIHRGASIQLKTHHQIGISNTFSIAIHLFESN